MLKIRITGKSEEFADESLSALILSRKLVHFYQKDFNLPRSVTNVLVYAIGSDEILPFHKPGMAHSEVVERRRIFPGDRKRFLEQFLEKIACFLSISVYVFLCCSRHDFQKSKIRK